MIVVSNLNAKRGTFSLSDISFDVKDGSTLIIMGPNGCGKTTLLECIAGLQKVDSGSIVIDGVDVTKYPPEKRGVGYVPQDYALFPNMTVRKNILLAFKKSRGMGFDDLQRITRLLRIDNLMDRRVESLSSGQKQRVAIARALAAKPRVLLLDEPCSALDPPTREAFKRGMDNILKEAFREFNIPVLYATHDILEATAIGDKVALMNSGRIEQVGSVAEVFESPRSKFVAEFLGFNVLEGRVLSSNDAGTSIDVGGVVLSAEGRDGLPEGVRDVVVIIKPQDVILSLTKDALELKWSGCRCNALSGIVRQVYIEGSMAKVDVEIGDVGLKSYVNSEYLKELGVKPGGKVFVHIKASKIIVLPKHDWASHYGDTQSPS